MQVYGCRINKNTGSTKVFLCGFLLLEKETKIVKCKGRRECFFSESVHR